MPVSVTQTLTIMSSPPLPSRTVVRPSAFSPPMSPSSVLSATSSPSTPGSSISTLTYSLPKSLKRQRPEPLSQPLTSAAAAGPQSATATLPASYSASSASIFALSDLNSPTRPTSVKRSKPSSAGSLASPSSNSSSSHSEHSPISPFSTSSSVSPSSTSSVTGFASFLPQPPVVSTTTSATTSPTSPTASPASLPPLLVLSIPNRTSWFSLHSVDAIEKRALPEFFTKRNPPPTVTQANTRTPLPLVHPRSLSPNQPTMVSIVPPPSLSSGSGVASYMRYRNTLLLASALRPDVYLTGTESRRMLGGVNAASVLRIHAFLQTWGLINQHAQPLSRKAATGSEEEAGVGAGMSEEAVSVSVSGKSKRRRGGGRREAMDSVETFVDKTFDSLDDESSVMHDMSLPIAMGIAV